VHLHVDDLKDSLCFDMKYAVGNEKELAAEKSIKHFGKDAMGNQITYRVIATNGRVVAVYHRVGSAVQTLRFTEQSIKIDPGTMVTAPGGRYISSFAVTITYLRHH
jgi:hypothetical protein